MESYHHKFTSIHPPPPKKSPSRHHIVTFPPLSCAAVPAHSPARGSVPPRLCVLRLPALTPWRCLVPSGTRRAWCVGSPLRGLRLVRPPLRYASRRPPSAPNPGY